MLTAIRIPGFIAPHWQPVRPFALQSRGQFRPGPPAALTSQAFPDQAQPVVDVQEKLIAQHKVDAEYWADGPSAELPPGHREFFAAFVLQRDRHTLDAEVKMFFALANAIHDAATATAAYKRHCDDARPVTTIRHLFRGKRFRGWTGTAEALIDGQAWRPCQVSIFPAPTLPDCTSGHSAFPMAGAEALKRFTGSDAFGASHTQTVPLHVEPCLAAAVGTVLSWEAFTEVAVEAGESRLQGGIHFYEGNVAGRALGRKVGAQAFDLAQRYRDGRL